MPSLVGQNIGEIGYGLMGLTWRPTPPPEEQAFAAMKASLAAGNVTWNAGDFYGTPEYNSLHIVNRYFTKYPEDASKVVLSIKSGLKNWTPDGSPENIKASIDYCMKILDGKKTIDIYEMARVDKKTPLEITMNALNEHIKLGNIKGIALSEAGPATIREAAKYAQIVAVEAELSLWSMDILTNGVASTCAELDIPIIAYSPIGRGMLTGEIQKPEDIPEGDFRHNIPRFSKENFPTNLKLVAELQTLAKAKGVTPAQLAIGWVKYLSKRDGNPEFIPIPGATTAARVQENLTTVALSSSDIASINSILKEFRVAGERYNSHGMATVNA